MGRQSNRIYKHICTTQLPLPWCLNCERSIYIRAAVPASGGSIWSKPHRCTRESKSSQRSFSTCESRVHQCVKPSRKWLKLKCRIYKFSNTGIIQRKLCLALQLEVSLWEPSNNQRTVRNGTYYISWCICLTETVNIHNLNDKCEFTCLKLFFSSLAPRLTVCWPADPL